MNVKELKKLARDWIDASPRSTAEFNASQSMHDAIMALPDDPHQEHEDLVELAQAIVLMQYNKKGEAYKLASMVIERFGKREPRKVEAWAVMCGPAKEIFDTKDEALERMATLRDLLGKPSLWLARLTGTEEV